MNNREPRGRHNDPYPRSQDVRQAQSWAEPPSLREHATRWTPWVHVWAFVFGIAGAYVAYLLVRRGTLARRHARAAVAYSAAHTLIAFVAWPIQSLGFAWSAGDPAPGTPKGWTDRAGSALVIAGMIMLLVVSFMHLAQSNRNYTYAKNSLEPRLGWLQRFYRPEKLEDA